MRRRRLPPLFSLLLFIFLADSATAAAPKLIVIVVGDQIRADYLERFHDQLVPDGLRRFRDQGTYYTHARQDHAITKTSPGHALIGSGIYGKDSGIVGNEWYDTASHKSVSAAELIPGGQHTQLKWFMGRSFAQRLHKMCPTCRVVSLSLKDRGALLLTGPDQDEAYWWDQKAHDFTSYHGPSDWLTRFNDAHHDSISSKSKMASAEADRMTELLAEEVLQQWKLGQENQSDVLTVSFSAVDLVGHDYGPDSPQVKVTFLNLDVQVARLMEKVEKTVGPEVVWAFSSDHGVTPLPEVSKSQGLPAGRVSLHQFELLHSFRIKAVSQPFIYVSNPKAVSPLKESLLKTEGVQAVYTSSEITAGQAPIEVTRDFYPGRCGDLWVVLKPKYIFSDGLSGTTHGQPTDDDERVPLGYYGQGFAAAVHDEPASVSTIAYTLLKLIQK